MSLRFLQSYVSARLAWWLNRYSGNTRMSGDVLRTFIHLPSFQTARRLTTLLVSFYPRTSPIPALQITFEFLKSGIFYSSLLSCYVTYTMCLRLLITIRGSPDLL